jgi:hypothetical protein
VAVSYEKDVSAATGGGMIAVTATYLTVVFAIVLAMFSADTVTSRLRKRQTAAVMERAGLVSLREGPLLLAPVPLVPMDGSMRVSFERPKPSDTSPADKGTFESGALQAELAGESDVSELGESIEDVDDEVPESDGGSPAAPPWQAQRDHVQSTVRQRKQVRYTAATTNNDEE